MINTGPEALFPRTKAFPAKMDGSEEWPKYEKKFCIQRGLDAGDHATNN